MLASKVSFPTYGQDSMLMLTLRLKHHYDSSSLSETRAGCWPSSNLSLFINRGVVALNNRWMPGQVLALLALC